MESELIKNTLFKGLPGERIEWRCVKTGKLHNPHGPAIEFKNGNWIWYQYDVRHRLDGPAMLNDEGYHYFIFGKNVSKEEWDSNKNRLWTLKGKLNAI